MNELTSTILERNLLNPHTTFEFVSLQDGVFCGLPDVIPLARASGGHLWALDERAALKTNQVALRLRGPFIKINASLPAIGAALAQQSAWASAARAFAAAANELPIIALRSNLIAPNALASFEYAVQSGGCLTLESPYARGLASRELILLLGDTLSALQAFDSLAPHDAPRLIFVDTFHEPATEATRVALGLGDKLVGVVVQHDARQNEISTATLKQIRAQLDLAGFPRIKIFVYGAFAPTDIARWLDETAPLDGFFVSDTIALTPLLPFQVELKESDGKPLGRHGLTPGTTPSPRLKRIPLE